MGRELFGTDGIRGKAGEPPLDKATAFALGAALGEWARGKEADPKVLLGMDTRESGPWLAAAVAAGLASTGVEPVFAGLLTTPGVAWNTRNGPFVAGVMISASHNPYFDNGLKVFDHSGYKLPDEQELALEAAIFRIREAAVVPEFPLTPSGEWGEKYLNFLASTFPARLDGLHLVVDCAHGAASTLAPALFERLGARLTVIGNQPDGRNINAGVGALHTDHLREAVLQNEADLGVAFDGDADRAMFVSASGKHVDGDGVLLICARRLALKHVVATVMSNLGLELALREAGISLARTSVGDKYVLEEMLRSGAKLGGEQSGHVIFTDYATTGDGMLTALQVLAAMREAGATLDELLEGFTVFPQLLKNVRISERTPIVELAGVQEAIRECEEDFAGKGRVLVRYSGTEPLARVMVEGDDPEMVERHTARIAQALSDAIGIK